MATPAFPSEMPTELAAAAGLAAAPAATAASAAFANAPAAAAAAPPPASAATTTPSDGAVQGTSPGCFAVTCKNFSMYGKRMRDVHIAGFSVQSDAVIRFRTRDGKVAVGDLLVVMGRYPSVKNAQEAIFNLIDKNDGKLSDLGSLEVDKEIFDQKVCTFSNYYIFCTMADFSAMVLNKFKYYFVPSLINEG
jgi:hypothetical protein